MSAPQIAAPGPLTWGAEPLVLHGPVPEIRQLGEAVPYPPQREAGAEDSEPEKALEETTEAPDADVEHDQAPTHSGTQGWATVTQLPTVDESSGADAEPALDAEGQAPTLERSEEADPKPDKPARPPRSWLRHATVVGYWMSVSVGAGGQVWSLGAMINQGLLGYAVATLGAAFAEVTMIGAGKWAKENRMDGKPWKMLLALASIVCGYATAMNAVHWAARSVGMAVTFAGGSALGFAVETTIEQIDAATYTRDQEKYEDDLRRWQNRQKVRPRTTAAAPNAPKTASATRSTTSASRSKSGKAAAAARKARSDQLLAEIVQWAKDNQAGHRRARKAFAGRRGLPSETTIKRALAEAS